MTAISPMRASVLVIDGEQRSLDELKTLLCDKGYKVVTAATGRAGLEHLDAQRFDVILTNMHLPDASGLDLLTKIKQIDPDAKVYLMGTHITPAIILESVNRGAFDLLYKPFVSACLIPMIELQLTREPPLGRERARQGGR